MLGTTILAWATLMGTALSLVGVAIAIVQIRQTKKSAEAARLAATEARAALSGNVLLTDLAGCVRSIEEIKAHIRSSRFEAALLRITDTRASLIQLRSMVSKSDLHATVQHVVTQLAVLSDVLEVSLNNGAQDIDAAETMRSLAESSDLLVEWLGRAKYLAKDTANAS